MSELYTEYCHGCGWVGSSAEVRYEGNPDDIDAFCPECGHPTEDQGKFPPAQDDVIGHLYTERKAREYAVHRAEEAEAQVEELRNVLKHCLYRLEDNVQCLQSAGYFAERDATKLAIMRAQEVLGGLKGE